MKYFRQHPNSVGMTYFEHFYFAWKLSLLLFKLSIISFIHGALPLFFQDTTSISIKKINKMLQERALCFCCCCLKLKCKCSHISCCCKK